MKKKYKILKDDHIISQGSVLYRIKALKKFGNIKKGELGGYIEKESNLSQSGVCWVYPDSAVLDNAKVSDDAVICNDSVICDFARVSGNAYIAKSSVYDHAEISGYTVVDNSVVNNNSIMEGNAIVNNSTIEDNARIKYRAQITNSIIINDAKISGEASVTNSYIYKNANISGNASIKNAHIGLYGDIHCPYQYISIGPIGSRDDYTTFYCDDCKHIMVSCGCFNGYLKDFVKEVKKTYKHNKTYRKQYLNAVKYVKSIL